MKKIMLVFLTVFLICVLSFQVLAQDENLLKNPSFEDGSNADWWGTWAWNQPVTNFTLINDTARTGDKCVSITNNEENDGRYKQTVAIEEKSMYRFSCWTKAENVGDSQKGANISIEGILESSDDIKGTSDDWQYLEMYINTGEGVNSIVLTLGLGGYGSTNSGTAWFDDAELVKVNSIPQGANVAFIENKDEEPGKGDDSSSEDKPRRPFWLILVVFIIGGGAYLHYRYKGRKIIETDFSENTIISIDSKDIHKDFKISSPIKVTKAEQILPKLTVDKKDLITMGCMTLIYLIIALVNLGDLKAPETYWNPANSGENVTVDLGRTVELSRISFFCGLGTGWYAKGAYRVEYMDESGEYRELTTLNKDNVFVWKYSDISVQTAQVKITVDQPGGELREIAFFEKGFNKPVEGINILSEEGHLSDKGSIKNLFDEQTTAAFQPDYMNGTYFDEIYHARTAYEHLHRLEPYENTHPPLGKIFIAIGISIFGMNPFGWRIIGTLFGAAMIPVMFLFGKKMFGKWFYGFAAGFLIMFDFMHFSQTRIATIDVYVTFFVILMFYYMYDYFVNKSYNVGFKESLKPLLLSGLFLGLGAASKWIALYGAAGLAFLFFLAKLLEYIDYINTKNLNKSKRPLWLGDFIPFYINRTFALCFVFFLLIPLIIYVFSYIPFMLVPGPGHGLKEVISFQSHMYNYHSQLKETHSFSSNWYEWPLMIKPIWYYNGSGLEQGKASTIASFGNPAIWWAGIAAFFGSIILTVTRRDKKMIVVFTAIAAQYLPWIFVPRISFIYHFFSIIPFIILSIVYVLKYYIENYKYGRYAAYLFLGIVLILFVLYYPVLSGMVVNKSYIDGLKLMKGWYF